MRHAHHSIHRQSLEVAFERPGQEPGMQERLAAVYYERILPELDKVFDEFEEAWPGRLTIPEVSIDCGILREADWEEALAARVFGQVREELQRYRGLHEEPMLLERRWNAEFIHFLQTGQFQWDSRKELPADYDARLVLNDVFLEALTAAMRKADDVSKRLFHYCTPGFIVRLADALVAGHIPAVSVSHINVLKQAGVDAAIRSRAVISAYCNMHGQLTADEGAFASALVSNVWPFVDSAQRTRIVEQIAPPSPANAAIERQGETKHQELAPPQAKGKNEETAKTVSLAEQKVADQKTAEQRIATELYTDRVVDTYYIANAGLVLAYPFIAPLLQRTGLMDDEQQFSPEAAGNAALLLQHLVYESPLIEEHDLLLNKVLVGLQPTAFVDPALVEYTRAMRQECEDVLHAILTHWSVLRNTSVAGIRETFFQRSGKLSSRVDGWLLQVEGRGVDVLLASLPWSISIIKLPWMDGILYVEWA